MTAIPLWLKIGYTAFVLLMIVVYALKAAAGPRNFLWFSDIALFGTVIALWLESPLIASTMAVSVVLIELAWTISFLSGLLFGRPIRAVGDYMFDPREHWYMRALSLFHIHMPAVLLWMLWRFGYDERALALQTIIAWIVIPVTYAVSGPQHNINRVYGPGSGAQRRVHPLLYLAALMLFMPLVIYLPSHLLLKELFAR